MYCNFDISKSMLVILRLWSSFWSLCLKVSFRAYFFLSNIKILWGQELAINSIITFHNYIIIKIGFPFLISESQAILLKKQSAKLTKTDTNCEKLEIVFGWPCLWITSSWLSSEFHRNQTIIICLHFCSYSGFFQLLLLWLMLFDLWKQSSVCVWHKP